MANTSIAANASTVAINMAAITSVNNIATANVAAITSVNTRINAVSVLAETKASAATSANLETRIASVSATFASTSATLETRIATVSSTMATSIGNQMPKAGGTFTGPVVFNADGFTVNSNASAVFNGPARLNSSTHLGNSTSDVIYTTARFGGDLIPTSNTGKDLGTNSLRWDTAYINTFRGGINAVFTSVTGLLYPSPYGKAPATVDYVTSAVAAKASVGTSATLETRINAVSVLAETKASATTSATLETRIASVSSTFATTSATLATSIATAAAAAVAFAIALG